MEILEELRLAIEAGRSAVASRLVEQALDEKLESALVVEEAMVPAMRNVGERYKRNEVEIPQILAAARSIRKGFEILEKRDGELRMKSKGTIILGTVEGDLHDVGKNLVAIMFRSAGFRVIDLGVDISEKQFLNAVRENPDVSIVCVSSLLSTALPEMEKVVKSLRKRVKNRKFKIMVGGGAVSEKLALEMGADAYTETCVDAAEMAKTFIV